MVRFYCSRFSEDMTPVIRDVEIAKYAERVMSDYRPELLRTDLYLGDPFYEPALLDPYDFAEHYLGANMEIHDIYTDSKDETIAGAAVFNLQMVKVFDRENMCTREIEVPPNTILLDSETTNMCNEGFEHFTVMHESGHLMMHQSVFRTDQKEMDDGNAVLCKRSNMGRMTGGLKTNEDFLEHQANTFAASMLMPPRTFIPYAQMLMNRYRRFREEGIMITYDFSWGDARFGYYVDVVGRAARRFGVSRRAAEVQMRKYGLQAVPKERVISEARRRLKMYQSLYM